MSRTTLMAAEIAEIPDVIARQLDALDTYLEAGRRLHQDGTRGLVTCGRGTSDHAATFFKYLMETKVGLPVASIGPSVATVYGSKLRLAGFACLTFSQSGGSPDLAALQQAARDGGARTTAVLNVLDSPVGEGADLVLPVLAGPERAVAATKSFVGMMVASLAIVAGYLNDGELPVALKSLPDLARDALGRNWSHAGPPLVRANSLYCVGRGLNMAVAAEAALKLKETCHLHAEACSAAELFHGPVAIADGSFGALVFGARGGAERSIDASIARLRELGVSVYKVESGSDNGTLSTPATEHEALDPVLQAIAFYKFAEGLAVNLGEDPDAPPGLKKVTETV